MASKKRTWLHRNGVGGLAGHVGGGELWAPLPALCWSAACTHSLYPQHTWSLRQATALTHALELPPPLPCPTTMLTVGKLTWPQLTCPPTEHHQNPTPACRPQHQHRGLAARPRAGAARAQPGPVQPAGAGAVTRAHRGTSDRAALRALRPVLLDGGAALHGPLLPPLPRFLLAHELLRTCAGGCSPCFYVLQVVVAVCKCGSVLRRGGRRVAPCAAAQWLAGGSRQHPELLTQWELQSLPCTPPSCRVPGHHHRSHHAQPHCSSSRQRRRHSAAGELPLAAGRPRCRLACCTCCARCACCACCGLLTDAVHPAPSITP